MPHVAHKLLKYYYKLHSTKKQLSLELYCNIILNKTDIAIIIHIGNEQFSIASEQIAPKPFN